MRSLRRTLSVTLVVCALVAPVGPVSADTPPPPRESFLTNRARILHISTVLTDAEGPLAGRTVELRASAKEVNDGAWGTVTSVETDEDGRAVVEFLPKYRLRLRWRWAGDETHAGDRSPIRTLDVSSLSITRVAGRPNVIRGRLRDGVGDALVGRKVALQRRTCRECPWERVRVVTTDDTGRLRTTVPFERGAGVRWRWRGTPRIAGSKSEGVRLRLP